MYITIIYVETLFLRALNQLIRNSAMQKLCFIFLPVMTAYADNTFVTSCRLHLNLCVPA